MLKQKHKTIIIMVLSVILAVSLSGCGDGFLGGGAPKVYDDEGNQAVTPYSEINPERRGLYVPVGDDEAVVPLVMDINETTKEMFEGAVDLNSSLVSPDNTPGVSMKWAASAGADKKGRSLDMLKFIPVIDYDKRPIFAILPTEDDINTAVWATPFDLQGYSFGAPFYVSGDERSLYIDTNKVTKGSTMEAALSANGLLGQTVRVISINDEKALPISSIDLETGFMKGLQKQGLYQFKVYKGTKTVVIDVLADTLIFEQDTSVKPTGLKYTVTESGYYYINTSGLDKGRYYLIEPFGSMVKTYAGDPQAQKGQSAGSPDKRKGE